MQKEDSAPLASLWLLETPDSPAQDRALGGVRYDPGMADSGYAWLAYLLMESSLVR